MSTVLEIPLQPIASQIVSVVLNEQNCQIAIYQKDQGLFIDLTVDTTDVCTCVIARDGVPIVRNGYLYSFVGDLYFIDTQGASDPDYTGLGSRFTLVYVYG